jgi:FtsH-binding integral membrane protein
MNDPFGYNRGFGARSVDPTALGVRPNAQLSAGFLTQAFGWMFAGLLLTAGVAVLVNSSPQFLDLAAGLFLPALLVELGLVFAISLAITRINASVALGMFFVYAALNGLTFGMITAVTPLEAVGAAFFSAAAMFGAAAVYGAVTKRSLASLGGILMMGLIGLIVAMVVNLFLQSAAMGYITSVIGVVLFTALTAYDTQRIAQGQLAARLGSMEKAAVFGALQLYLDFVNLFLFLLRLFGGQRR